MHQIPIQVELLKTSWFENCLDPVWDEVYTIPVCHSASAIRIKVMDREHIGAEEIGEILISTKEIISYLGSLWKDGILWRSPLEGMSRAPCILASNFSLR